MTVTVEIEGIGLVTFKPLGKLAMERVREAARRGAVSPASGADTSHIDPDELVRMREDALLNGRAVVEPQFSEEELARVGAEPLRRLADAIREASWPNR